MGKVKSIIFIFFLLGNCNFLYSQNEDTSIVNSNKQEQVEDTTEVSREQVKDTLKDSQSQNKEVSDAAKDKKEDQNKSAADFNPSYADVNRIWILLSALLVFFMQAGFKVFEVGLVRKKDGDSVGFKNLVDWMVMTLAFLLFGFGFMFGESWNGFIGLSLFGLEDFSKVQSDIGLEYFLFQLAFAATAATIVSGALAIRIKLLSYMILAFLIGVIIYPLFGHWVWGHFFLGEGPGQEPFLAKLGFIDFAGSTVVHSVGAWIAITGMFFIRPRIGKVNMTGDRVEIRVPNDEIQKFEPHNLGYSVLGVLILWIGWWGFNGGSNPLFEESGGVYSMNGVSRIILNTNIAAVTGGLSSFFYAFALQKKDRIFQKTLGGILGGLVAITACCHVVSIVTAMIIGVLAGIVHNIVFNRLEDKTLFGRIIDDPVGAIPVHGACGILGTLCVALGKPELIKGAQANFFNEGLWSVPYQLFIQLLGVVLCAVITITLSALFFTLLNRTIGLEVSIEQEKEGKSI